MQCASISLGCTESGDKEWFDDDPMINRQHDQPGKKAPKLTANAVMFLFCGAHLFFVSAWVDETRDKVKGVKVTGLEVCADGEQNVPS